MMNALFFLLAAPVFAADIAPVAEVVVSTPVAEAPKPPAKPVLMPPKPPVRAKASLDSAGDVARDLAAAVEYFEAGQSYYRAFTKGSHSHEENAAFVRFLEEYEQELAIARKTHLTLGLWLEKKSAVKD